MTTDDQTDADDVPDRFNVDFTGATLLGIYQVEAKLAEGGMGSVYRGRDTNLGRPVVIKVPHVRFVSEAGFRKRFGREIEELVRLEHPHIVRILAQGQLDDVPFFVLQFLGGGSLEDVLAHTEDGTSIEDALRWFPTIATTLDFVHGRGTVHRDVKPANILFDEEGHVFLSDFGVAKALEDDDADVTDVGTGVGSPGYMAPEQITGGDLTPAADQYALASALYESLAGGPPFREDSAIEVLMKKRSENPTPLSARIGGFDEAASDAVARALSREPSDRFESCSAFAAAFQDAVSPKSDPAEVHVSRMGPVLWITVLVLLLVTGTAFAVFGRRPSGEPAGGATNEAGSMRLVLLDPGVEPRRALRLDVEPGPLGSVELTSTQDIVVHVDGQEEPIKFGRVEEVWSLDLVVDDVSPDGDIRIRWTTADIEFTAPEGGTGATPSAAPFKSLAGTIDLAPNGIVRDSELTGIDEAHNIGREMQRKAWTIRNLAPVFPKERVGVGARWDVTESATLIGLRLTNTVTYEIVKIDGDLVELAVYVTQSAAKQQFALFGEKKNATLLSLHAAGESQSTADLGHIVPLEDAFEMTMTMEMEMRNMNSVNESIPELVRSQVDVMILIETRRK